MFALTRLTQLLSGGVFALLSVTLFAVAPATPVAAQNAHSPVIRVNDKVITRYELKQREMFLKALNAPGSLAQEARKQLIEDRLKTGAGEALGITVSAQDMQAGMTEFAARANLSAEDFTKALNQFGIATQTFEAFIRSGLTWRQVVRQRFAGRVNVSEDQVDRALKSSGGSNVRVLLSEIIMPAPPRQAEAVRARAERIAQLRSTSAFSAQARKYSATASRRAGGKLPWQNLSDLPPGLAPLILGLAPGEVTAPIPIPNAVALFQLRAIEEGKFSKPAYSAIEYATYLMPGGRSAETLAKAKKLSRRLDRCDDLYGVAKGQPKEVLTRKSQKPGEIPTDIAIELSKLDPGETSMALTRNKGQSLMLVMLCGRSSEIAEDINRDEISVGLRNRRIQSLANGYLAELRSRARIVEK